MRCLNALVAGTLATGLILPSAAAPPRHPRNRPPRAGRRLILLDEHGAPLGVARYVWLHPGRVGVPVSAYRRLGLFVRRLSARRVELAVPNSDVFVTFSAGSRRLRWDSANLHGIERHRYPLARRAGGEIFVAPRLVYFGTPPLVTIGWEPRTRTLSLRRTRELARLKD